MTRREFLLGWTAIVALSSISYLNLAKFGHLPDAISMEKIKKSSHFKHGHFHNMHRTPQMTGKGGFFSTMWDFYFGHHPDTKPTQSIPAVKTDLKKLPLNTDLLVWFGHSSSYFQLNGKKYLILSTVNAFGGKNSFLGISYIVLGGISIILAIVFVIGYNIHSKKQK